MIKNISNLGDAALYCDFGNEVNKSINSQVIKYFKTIKEKKFDKKSVDVNKGDLVLFPSSLFHHTIPFKSNLLVEVEFKPSDCFIFRNSCPRPLAHSDYALFVSLL